MGLQMAGLPAANNYVAITQKTLSATATTNIRCHHRRMPTIQTTTTAIAVTIAIAIANVVRKLNNTISVTSSSISATLLLLLILLTWNPATIGVDAVREYKYLYLPYMHIVFLYINYRHVIYILHSIGVYVHTKCTHTYVNATFLNSLLFNFIIICMNK